jgi:methylmalonyl-CoA mutase C-terminal domain/subunit
VHQDQGWAVAAAVVGGQYPVRDRDGQLHSSSVSGAGNQICWLPLDRGASGTGLPCQGQRKHRGQEARMGTIRVVIAKPGLDGHDRGAKVVARALRDAGVEVIYTGLHQTPEQIVAAAIQEDADAVGLSILSGAHMTQFAAVLDLLAERGASDIVVFGGGIVPDADIAELERMGVAKIFTPGASTYEIVDWVRATLGGRSSAEPAQQGS